MLLDQSGVQIFCYIKSAGRARYHFQSAGTARYPSHCQSALSVLNS